MFASRIAVQYACIASLLAAHEGRAQTVLPEDYAIDVSVHVVWTATPISVANGDEVFIYARGTIGRDNGNDWRDWHGPIGVIDDASVACTSCPLPGYPRGALVARVGEGPAFYVGNLAVFVSETSGVLHLGVNDEAPGGNTGTLRAFVWRRGDVSTAIDDEPAAAERDVLLQQNVPNPFNPTTTIRYSIPVSGSVVLEVFDVAGSLVATLVEGPQPAGEGLVVWKGTDHRGARVASGVYFCRLRAPGATITRKMLLLR